MSPSELSLATSMWSGCQVILAPVSAGWALSSACAVVGVRTTAAAGQTNTAFPVIAAGIAVANDWVATSAARARSAASNEALAAAGDWA